MGALHKSNFTRQLRAIAAKYPADVLEEALKRVQDRSLEAAPANIERNDVRERARRDFKFFLQEYLGHYFTDEFGEQHLEVIADVQKFRKAGGAKRPPIRMTLAMSRGFGKSTLLSLGAVLWNLINGTWRFPVIISSTKDAAKGFLAAIIEEIEDNEKLAEAFPELGPQIDAKGQTVSWKDHDIAMQGGFRILAVGFLNAIRGKRKKQFRPDVLIVDDPDEEKDVNSQTTMLRKYRWFERAALKLGTAWGIDVLMSYTTIAANCVGEYVYNHKTRYRDWIKKKFHALKQDPETGEWRSTWEAGAPTETLIKEREEDPITFAQERQNEPIPEVDQVFKGKVQKYHFHAPATWEGWRLALAVDPSLGRNSKGCPSAIIGAAEAPDGQLYQIYEDVALRSPDVLLEAIIDALTCGFPWTVAGTDTSGNQQHFLDRLEDRIREHNIQNPSNKIQIPLFGLQDGGGADSAKIARITTSLQPRCASGLLKIREDSVRLYDDLNEFPYRGLDSADALEYAIRLLCGDKRGQVFIPGTGPQAPGQQPGGKSIDQILAARMRRVGLRV